MATGSDKYYTLFNSIDEGYLLCEVIFDEAGRAVDLFHLEANPAANHILGMDLTGRRSSEFNTDDRESWYEMLGMVVITGESYRTERYSEPHQKWFDFYVTKIGDPDSRLVAIVFHDVTDRKRREAHLHFLSEVSREFSRLSSAE